MADAATEATAMDGEVAAAADLFKVLSDPTRLRLAALLVKEQEVCVCRLAEALEADDNKVSQHLAVLRAAGLVEARRQGTWMHYRLREPRTGFERGMWTGLRVGLNQSAQVEADRLRLFRVACGKPADGSGRRPSKGSPKSGLAGQTTEPTGE